MEIINKTELSAYPGVRIKRDDTADLVIELTNGIVSAVSVGDETIGGLTPVPAQVRAIALFVAARALGNPENADSITTGIDDWKKTIRFRLPELADEAGVFLTDGQTRMLRDLLRPARRGPRGVGSIRLGVPGYGSVRY